MAAMETAELAPGYTISRVIRGGWQLAGGHGPIERSAAVADLVAAFEAGITTFDCADIYTGVEELYGALRVELVRRQGRAALDRLKIHTKFVPDLDILPRIRKADVEAIIDRSLKRLGMEQLDLVQFHWWDLSVPGAVQSALWLKDLQQAGKIDRVGATNFGAADVQAFLDAGVPLASLQVQYSVLDRRPAQLLADLCKRAGVQLLCYGSVAGGFLSDRWLDVAEPSQPLPNRSLAKYKLIIDDAGGWPVFQGMLHGLGAIAKRHRTDIATIASRFVLDQPQVAAVIVGATNRAHLVANSGVSALHLNGSDHAQITALLARLRPLGGDVYDLERDRSGRHGSIMKYNLSTLNPNRSAANRVPSPSA